jgi:hypothetical protein
MARFQLKRIRLKLADKNENCLAGRANSDKGEKILVRRRLFFSGTYYEIMNYEWKQHGRMTARHFLFTEPQNCRTFFLVPGP